MLRSIRAVGVLLLLIVPAFGQQSGVPSSQPPGANPAAANTGPTNIQRPTPGDRWTYDVNDDIAGGHKLTRNDMITEVSQDAIVVRYEITESGNSGNIVYDRVWNIVRSGPFRYVPNDGTGIRPPLTLGAQWNFAIDAANSRNGMTFKRTGTSKVVGRESVTTKAGTFDTFVIQTDFTGRNVQDPTLINQTSWRTWFAPDIDHWVKRTAVQRQRGHVIAKETIELTQYSHGKHE